ncbi:MAG: hypothetical protein D6830_02150, partial [Ignavibacteria bacterium]
MKSLFAITFFLALFTFIEIEDEPVFIAGFELEKDDYNWIENTIEQMSLFDKCGQLVIPYAYSFDVADTSDDYKRLIELVTEYKVGGFLFLSGTTDNLIRTTNKLQSLAEIPLLISADFERGPGMRLEDLVEFPSNMALGAADNPEYTYLVGKATAEISRLIGVHQNYAPLVDVNSDYRNPIINTRSFAENPFNIAVHASAFIHGMNDGKMISTAKHFPGHGSTDVDSHSDLPVIHKTAIQLEENDLIPFRESIAAGVKSIMVGHLSVPSLDADTIPATFSKKIISGLLKKSMGFDGLVISDAMNMHSISEHYSMEDAVVKAINAGTDLILFPANDSAAVYGLYNAVRSGKISEQRLDESLNKVLAAKSWLGLTKKRFVDENIAPDKAKKKKYFRLSKEIAEHSVTLVKDNSNLVPLNLNKFKRVSAIALTDLTDRVSIDKPLHFIEQLGEKIKLNNHYKLHLKSRRKDFRRARAIARKSDLIILPIYSAVRSFQNDISLPKKYIDFVNYIHKLKKPVVVISFGDPYLLKDIKSVPTYLCAYGSVDASEDAVVSALLGEIKIQGKLPVTIPNTPYLRGTGIQRNISRFSTDPDSLYDFSEVESLMNKAIEDSVFPGAVLYVGKYGRTLFHKAFGHYTYDKNSPAVDTNSIFDLASLSKVIGTTSAAMMLYDKHKLELDKRVIDYLPEFNNHYKDEITVRNLLLHNSGLPPFIPFYKYFSTKKEVIDSIMNCELIYDVGSKYVYSDLGMIVLQQIIERITG